MRYYSIVIRDKSGNVLIPNFNGQPGFTARPYQTNLSTYSSLNAGANVFQRGSTNPAAQRVEIDIGITAMDSAVPNSFVRVHGVGLAEIGQSANLNGLHVDIYAGMATGLPLANPNQSGLIASGQIVQAYGNWVGVEQTLNIFVGAGGSSPDSSETTGQPGVLLAPTTNNAPANITFQWKAGQPLLTPLINAFQTACPQYSVVGAVHPGLVWSGATSTGFYATLSQFAQFLRQKSLSIIGGYAPSSSSGAYPGVSLVLFNNTITIADGTTQTTPKQIQFIDLVGQPTNSQPLTVQACCVMRADIHCGDYVTLPLEPGITEASGGSQYYQPTPNNNGYSSQKSGSIFTGTFLVTGVRHVGDSRDPGFTAWVTTLDMKLASPARQVVPVLPTIWSTTVGPNKYGFFT